MTVPRTRRRTHAGCPPPTTQSRPCDMRTTPPHTPHHHQHPRHRRGPYHRCVPHTRGTIASAKTSDRHKRLRARARAWADRPRESTHEPGIRRIHRFGSAERDRCRDHRRYTCREMRNCHDSHPPPPPPPVTDICALSLCDEKLCIVRPWFFFFGHTLDALMHADVTGYIRLLIMRDDSISRWALCCLF